MKVHTRKYWTPASEFPGQLGVFARAAGTLPILSVVLFRVGTSDHQTAQIFTIHSPKIRPKN